MGSDFAKASFEKPNTITVAPTWVHSGWWPQACEEARGRWLNHLVATARRELVRGIEAGDTARAMDVLEKFDPDFRPHPKRVEVVGMLSFIQGLAPDEVYRVRGLPEADRRTEMLRLAAEAGLQVVD